MAISAERATELRGNLIATSPAFALIGGLSEPEQQHEAILTQLETAVLAASTDQNSLSALHFTGEPNFYPYSGQQAANFERETTKYGDVISRESVAYLLESGPRENPRVNRLLRAILPQYLSIQLEPMYGRYANERADFDKFWRPIAEGSTDNRVIQHLDKFSGENYWQKFMTFRSKFLKGLSKPEEIARDTRIFDIVERAAGQQDAEILFQTVEIIHDLGFSSIDDYLELILGDEPANILSDMDQLLNVFAGMRGKRIDGDRLYIARQQQTLEGIDIHEIPPDPIGLVNRSLEELGIAKEQWDEVVAVLTDVVPDLATAYFYLLPNLPNLMANYPGLEQHPTWQAIQKYQIILVTPANFDLTEEYRYLFHEAGHALEAFLQVINDIVNGQTQDQSFMGRPTPLREIFSLFHEGRMPQKEYFQARERFLTARFAALSRHEITLWHEAENVVNVSAENKEKAKRRFFSNVNRSYKETLGRATSSLVPTGRAVRDFFEPHNPGIAASYAYGMLVAASLYNQIDQANSPSQKRDILEGAVSAATQEDNVHQVLSRLGLKWDSALENLRNFFQ